MLHRVAPSTFKMRIIKAILLLVECGISDFGSRKCVIDVRFWTPPVYDKAYAV